MLGLALAGHALGSDWTSVRKGFEYVDYAVARADRRGHRLCARCAGAAARRDADGRCRRLSDSLPLRHAVALGLLQGPAELLPVSSSAHTELLPWLARWPYTRLDGEARKSFEVALHAGAALALAIHMRRELLRELAGLDRASGGRDRRSRWRPRRSSATRSDR